MYPPEVNEVFESRWKHIAKVHNEYCGHDAMKIMVMCQPDKFDVHCKCAECDAPYSKTRETIRAIFLPHFAPELAQPETFQPCC